MSGCPVCGTRIVGNVGHVCSRLGEPVRPTVDVVGIINRNAERIRTAESAKRLATLAHNLAIAAGLCRAFEQGRTFFWRAMDGLPASEDWRPGCQKDAP